MNRSVKVLDLSGLDPGAPRTLAESAYRRISGISPLREALTRLAAEGLVTSVQRDRVDEVSYEIRSPERRAVTYR